MPPPEGTPTANMTELEESRNRAVDAKLNLAPLVALPTVAAVITGIAFAGTAKKKKQYLCRLRSLRSLKAIGALFVVLVLSMPVLQPIVTASATLQRGAFVWGPKATLDLTKMVKAGAKAHKRLKHR